MQSRIVVLVCTVFLGAVRHGQSMPIRVHIAGHVTVTTSDSLARTAVLVTGRAARDGTVTAEKEFVFCIAHPEPLPSKLKYAGSGRVVYRVPRNEHPVEKTPGPEQILPALAVLQSDGESRFFLAEGQPYPLAPNERTVGRVTTFQGRQRDPSRSC
jgi:hypothetical protein